MLSPFLKKRPFPKAPLSYRTADLPGASLYVIIIVRVAGKLEQALKPVFLPCKRGLFMALSVRRFAVVAAVFLVVFTPSWVYGFDFSLWKGLLSDHVRSGAIKDVRLNVVDYSAMGRDKRFRELLDALDGFDPEDLGTRAERLAFWINVYNIFAISKVLEGYPVESIRDLGGIFKSVWKQKAGTIGGRSYSLDEIEHEILRPLGEPRIHFAIVCASVSCPDLATEPFEAEYIDAQLERGARSFLKNPAKGVRVDDSGRTVYISSIFKWFAGDFEPLGGVKAFISGRVEPDVRKRLTSPAYSIDYLDYDWSLNDSARAAY